MPKSVKEADQKDDLDDEGMNQTIIEESSFESESLSGSSENEEMEEEMEEDKFS